MDEFLTFCKDHPEYRREDEIRCPCRKCKNKKFQTEWNLIDHILKWGFIPNYYVWDGQGEIVRYNPMIETTTEMLDDETMDVDQRYGMHAMLDDFVAPVQYYAPEEPQVENESNNKTYRAFQRML